MAILRKLIQFFKNYFSSQQVEIPVSESVEENNRTLISEPAQHQEEIDKLEKEKSELLKPSANPSLHDTWSTGTANDPLLDDLIHLDVSEEVGSSGADRIIRLYVESETLVDVQEKSYFSSEGETRAEAIAKEVEEIRQSLAKDILSRLSTHESHLLRVPPIDRQQFASGLWRNYTWIDLLYTVDLNGEEIDYDFLAKNPRGAHLYRIWFTADGIGMGIRPGANPSHLTRNDLLEALPNVYEEFKPSAGNKHESFYDLRLKGRPGQKNQYCAVWYFDEFATGDAFFGAVEENWQKLGPILNSFRC